MIVMTMKRKPISIYSKIFTDNYLHDQIIGYFNYTYFNILCFIMKLKIKEN